MKNNKARQEIYTVFGKSPTELRIFTGETLREINNVVSNMNMWSYHEQWLTPFPKGYFSEVFPFVEEMQFMSATGGNCDFDLFRDPLNDEIKNDYDFSPLITACRNVVEQGVRPMIKLGSTPLKYSENHEAGVFGTNMYPPDNYTVYYDYIRAMTQALVDAFGLETVRTWRWGCLTEFENKDWLIGTYEDYCKIYDYSVAAIEAVLNCPIAMGAHCAGYNDDFVRNFIRHCAFGKNFCTGEQGSRLVYLAISYYDATIGEVKVRPSRFVETMSVLKTIVSDAIAEARTNGVSEDRLKDLGVTELFYGIDEGRILDGKKGAWIPGLNSRIVGDSKQAAYDAMLIEQMINHDIAYFSAWAYHTDIFCGVPTISYHVANEFYKMVGTMQVSHQINGCESEDRTTDAVASVDKDGNVYLLLYDLCDEAVAKEGPQEICLRMASDWKRASVCVSHLDDRSNFFDEWVADRERNQIVDEDFGWSPDGTRLPGNLITDRARALWEERMPYYQTCAQLYTEELTSEISDGELLCRLTLEPNSALFVVLKEINDKL